jgi:hypothetical protein
MRRISEARLSKSEGRSPVWQSTHPVAYVRLISRPIDDVHQQVALVVSLQEGLKFRLGDIEIIGLDSTLGKELRSKIRTGEILNFQLIVDFYQEHKSELPEEVLPEDTELRRNIKERTADALFDFRSSSQLQNLGTSILPIPNHSKVLVNVLPVNVKFSDFATNQDLLQIL